MDFCVMFRAEFTKCRPLSLSDFPLQINLVILPIISHGSKFSGRKICL